MFESSLTLTSAFQFSENFYSRLLYLPWTLTKFVTLSWTLNLPFPSPTFLALSSVAHEVLIWEVHQILFLSTHLSACINFKIIFKGSFVNFLRICKCPPIFSVENSVGLKWELKKVSIAVIIWFCLKDYIQLSDLIWISCNLWLKVFISTKYSYCPINVMV